jgi:hypothetical protein
MIQALGFQRALFLFLVGGLAVLLTAANYLFLVPKMESSTQTLNALRGQETTLNTEIETMRNDYARFEGKKILYADITRKGFFDDQNRVQARARLDAMQKLSKIVSARYEIRAATLTPLPSAVAVDDPSVTPSDSPRDDFVILQSPVTIYLSAIDDIDVYRFIHLLNYGFPGHVSIESIFADRQIPVTPEVIKQIGLGKPPGLVQVRIELLWRTMTKRSAIEPQNIAAPTPAVPEAGQP